MISVRLCGGMLVAMPTAMPEEPLTSRFGMRVGRTSGSYFAVVVVGAEIDGFLIDIFEQRGGDAREAGFGVPHGRGRVAIDGAEIALAIDQRIAHGERLRHADERIVDRRVAVRMEFAENFADDLGALAGGAVGREAHLVHAEKNAAMDGFEAVADIGKGAAHDHAHGVIEVRALHLVFDIDGQEIYRRPCRRGRGICGGAGGPCGGFSWSAMNCAVSLILAGI